MATTWSTVSPHPCTKVPNLYRSKKFNFNLKASTIPRKAVMKSARSGPHSSVAAVPEADPPDGGELRPHVLHLMWMWPCHGGARGSAATPRGLDLQCGG